MTTLCTRAVERDAMFLMTDLVFESGQPSVRVKVRNLSSYGMMIEGDLRLKRGTRVVAELRNIGPVAGVIVWVRAPRYGVAFEDEIDHRQTRSEVFAGPREAPGYARAAVTPARHGGWNGKLRRV